MADKKVVSIDLGREAVKFVYAQVNKGSVKLVGCQSVTLEISHDADDEAWRAAVLEVLKQQKAAGSLDKKSEIYVTLPSSQVLARALKVPTADLQNQIVEEAKKNLPLPIEDAEWGYNVVGEAGDSTYVSLLAIKTSVVEEIIYAMAPRPASAFIWPSLHIQPLPWGRPTTSTKIGSSTVFRAAQVFKEGGIS